MYGSFIKRAYKHWYYILVWRLYVRARTAVRIIITLLRQSIYIYRITFSIGHKPENIVFLFIPYRRIQKPGDSD